jgi:hypothetical protein
MSDEWTPYHELRKRTDPPPYGQGLDDEPARQPDQNDHVLCECGAYRVVCGHDPVFSEPARQPDQRLAEQQIASLNAHIADLQAELAAREQRITEAH